MTHVAAGFIVTVVVLSRTRVTVMVEVARGVIGSMISNSKCSSAEEEVD